MLLYERGCQISWATKFVTCEREFKKGMVEILTDVFPVLPSCQTSIF